MIDRDSIPLKRAQTISRGFDAGNFANAYTSTDLAEARETDLDHYPESDPEHSEHKSFWAAFVLGFFASYEDDEIGEEIDEVWDARGAIGPEILALGYIDPWEADLSELPEHIANDYTRSKRDGSDRLSSYTSVGCYPIAYVKGSSCYCARCAFGLISENDAKGIAAIVNYEDPSLYCDECNDRIESAYAEDEAG